MDVLYRVCAGIDVHKAIIWVCVRRVDGNGRVNREIRSFGTTTAQLLELSDWLAAQGVTHVAMESTGVFWKPIYNILEGRFEQVLGNARHMRNVPGRKTDVKDCEWIAQLLQHGLIKASFVPPKPVRELRDLTRTRTCLEDDKTRVVNRIHKVLEDANIKLGSVATDILGKSGRAMIQALIDGNENAKAMAELAKGRLKQKKAGLAEALEGRVSEHHRFMLRFHMDQVKKMEFEIQHLDTRIAEVMKRADSDAQREARKTGKAPLLPFLAALKLMVEMWGIDQRGAENILAEIGTDMSRFASHKHLASWAGMCPGNNISAGKSSSGKTNNGDKWLRRALVQAGWAASRSKKSYCSDMYKRIAARRGAKRAVMAVGHSLLVALYYMLRDNKPYKDLGAGYCDARQKEKTERHLVKRLEKLGYAVELKPKVA